MGVWKSEQFSLNLDSAYNKDQRLLHVGYLITWMDRHVDVKSLLTLEPIIF